MQKYALVLSCEHASNSIPKAHSHLFISAQHILRTHKAWDPGTKDITQSLAHRFKTQAFLGKHSRLLVDLNRSEHNPNLFSPYTKKLAEIERAEIVQDYYQPHWSTLRQQVQNHLRKRQVVLHIAVHSFTPILRGKVRQTDIGLLFDPSSKQELEFCKAWQQNLQQLSGLKVRRNYPYLGKNNSLPTHFRHEFPKGTYLGIELEVNQKHLRSPKAIRLIADLIQKSLAGLLKTSLT